MASGKRMEADVFTFIGTYTGSARDGSFFCRWLFRFKREQALGYVGLMPDTSKYRRVVLKLSGEALREPRSKDNISPQIVGTN